MKQAHHRRAGLTLTELLVVVAIIVIVTAVLAPLLNSTFEGREIREAARQINAYMQQAQARAKELGRPVGVMIQRTPIPAGVTVPADADFDEGYQLSLAEVPPPYTGFTPAARAYVQVPLNGGAPTGIVRIADPGFFSGIVATNDFIRFNFRGPKYRIRRFNQNSGSIVIAANEHGLSNPETPGSVRFAPASTEDGNHYSAPLKFEVFRRPKATGSTPLELPAGAAVVLNLSGGGVAAPNSYNAAGEETSTDSALQSRQRYIGLTEFQRPSEIVAKRYRDQVQNQPLTILFEPSGEVRWIYRVLPTLGEELAPYWSNFPPKRPQEKVYLFVGRQGVPRWNNLDDGSNLWITIDPQSGLITTAPNAIPLDKVANRPALIDRIRGVSESRQIAATGQSMGGL